jgi:transcriptional regulator with GAF, ATPase, and Fis domain
MRRRIEITFCRRSTKVLYGPPEKGANNWAPVKIERLEQIGARSPEVGEFDQADAQLTLVDVSRSPELTLLIEALVKNNVDSTRAPRHLGLSFSNFISKLRGLGFANKQ